MTHYKTKYIQIGSLKAEKKLPFFKKSRTIDDPHFIDGDALAIAIETSCNEFAEQGYEVISIMPTLRGEHHATAHSGYGYGVSDGVVITAKRAVGRAVEL